MQLGAHEIKNIEWVDHFGICLIQKEDGVNIRWSTTAQEAKKVIKAFWSKKIDLRKEFCSSDMTAAQIKIMKLRIDAEIREEALSKMDLFKLERLWAAHKNIDFIAYSMKTKKCFVADAIVKLKLREKYLVVRFKKKEADLLELYKAGATAEELGMKRASFHNFMKRSKMKDLGQMRTGHILSQDDKDIIRYSTYTEKQLVELVGWAYTTIYKYKLGEVK
ncbi:MAG: hypothetical protein ACRCZ0_09990 [Cetobacterium sp.]